MKLPRSLVRLLPLFFALSLAHAQSTPTQDAEIRNQLQRAAEYLRTRNANSAAEVFRAVLRSDPKNIEAHANLGVIAFFQNDFQQAAQHLRQALSLDPNLVKVQALLGICEHRLGQPSGPKLLEQSFPRLKDKKLQIQAGLELANIDYQNGNLDRAANVMQSLVDIDPDNVDVLFMTQQIHTELAEDTLNKLAILAPKSARMQQIIAERLINAGDLPQTIQHYKKSLEIDPKVPGVRFELAQAILQASPSDAAAQAEGEHQLQLAMKTDGDSAKIECALGQLALRRSDTAAADAHITRALQLNPQSVEAQLGVGRMLMTAGKPEEALKYLRMAVESDPLNSEAHYRLAAVYRKLDMDEAAHKEAHFSKRLNNQESGARFIPSNEQAGTGGDAGIYHGHRSGRWGAAKPSKVRNAADAEMHKLLQCRTILLYKRSRNSGWLPSWRSAMISLAATFRNARLGRRESCLTFTGKLLIQPDRGVL